MKRYFLSILAVIFIISLSACGRDSNNTGKTATHPNSAASQNFSEQSASNTQTSSDTATLIAYFTWADNTVVENPDNVDTDATTSASLLAPGNAAIIAEWIHQEIGGDLFSIKVNEPYSSNYDECLERAADEKAENARPALSTHVEDMEKYDTVFIGYPNWWYSCPMALLSFIEEYDLSGKKIVLFCTHGTGGLANSVRDITASLPENCTIEENVLGIYRPEVSQSQQSVLEWLNEIGYTSQNKEDNSEMTNETTNRQIRVQDDNGNTVVFELNESTAALELYNQLPLTVEVENYSNNEKIFYPDELNVTDAPAANTGAGTLAYYAPWGDVVMFYGDYNANSSLYELGHTVTGAEYISSLSGYIKIEPV